MIETNVVNFQQILIDDSKRYVIPSFQRPYVWGQKAWTMLWEDVLSLYKSRDRHRQHFFGIIVTMPIQVPLMDQQHLLIDGQQRLITLSILLAAIRDLSSNDNEKVKEFVNQLLLVKFLSLITTDQTKIIPQKQNKKPFTQIILGEETDQSQIYEAYQCFISKIGETFHEAIDFYQLCTIVANQFVMVRITIVDEEPYPILSTLNSHPGEFVDDKLTNYKNFGTESEIMGLIVRGESQHTEFKESACRNLFNGKDDNKIRAQIVKSVAAFMNGDTGGNLLIGVDDDGNIKGIEQEYSVANKRKANWDGYLLFLSNLLNDKLSVENPFRFYKITDHTLDKKMICRIQVKPASSPVYFNKKLFVRVDNQSLEMQGPDLLNYVNERWREK